MTLPQVEELFRYWTRFPPVHERVAVATGYQPPMTTEEKWAAGARNPREAAMAHRLRNGGNKGPIRV